jgi:hypothetical protein
VAENEYLARNHDYELNTGTEAAPVWVPVKGIDTWAHSESKNNADTTTNEDKGKPTHQVASRTHSFTMTGKQQIDSGDGSRDPGQLACEVWSTLVGVASLKQFRITPNEVIGGDVIGPFYASASVNLGGGGVDDPNKWELTVDVSGDLNP